MSYAAIHPDWEKPRRNMADGYSQSGWMAA